MDKCMSLLRMRTVCAATHSSWTRIPCLSSLSFRILDIKDKTIKEIKIKIVGEDG